MLRRRSWRATSSAASRLVSVIIFSMSLDPLFLPVLTSMAMRASVSSMTRYPPHGSQTWRWKASSICLWIPIFSKMDCLAG